MKNLFLLALLSGLVSVEVAAMNAGEDFPAKLSQKVANLRLSEKDFNKIINYVSNNEFGNNPDGIVSWNDGEDFASLGKGHFIWYPEGVPQKFEESFRKFAHFLGQRWRFEGLSESEEQVFAWAKNFIYTSDNKIRFCPWSTKSAFEAWKRSRPSDFRMLVQFLHHPKISWIQAQYLDADFKESLVKVVTELRSADDLRAMEAPVSGGIFKVRQKLEENILALLDSKMGYAALLDYRNFKGDGTDSTMRYKKVGWGLQQVLYYMRPERSVIATQKNFALAALNRLERRAKLSDRNIEREVWIHGWANRVLGYGFYDSDSEIKEMRKELDARGELKWPKLKISPQNLRSLF